jgi:hypothetical protein
MNHNILLVNLERLHEQICKLEQSFEATHLGTRNQNLNPTHNDYRHQGNPTHRNDYIDENPAMLTNYVHDAVSLADKIIRTIESWAYDRSPTIIARLPTDDQVLFLKNYISRYKRYATLGDLTSALTPKLASITPYIRHFEAPMWRAIHAAYDE